ncbi:pimeloyl-ACP methyl ester esterase BioH [Celerinatantimonas yamalensis]|uniref:Pimeloyl-[acyl-carrier protein] methyl ester esterase n=1 Tax=Celerinatantimonas yamalensis TaxID=559956 RepID=A0ABW9G8V0_9GAMM
MLHIESKGTGTPLILLHGWGMNSGVWSQLSDLLSKNYQVYWLDLPGYGFSQPCSSLDWRQTVDLLANSLPRGIWLGWSLGGLLAQQVAISYPQKVMRLVTVASSARFVEQPNWPGMKAQVLELFARSLVHDYQKTLERFLAIQTLGSPQAKADIQTIKKQLEQRPLPDLSVLQQGLQWLAQIDLREQVQMIQAPWLQLYGHLDSLVPRQSQLMHAQLTQAQQHVFAKASHAPFISHLNDFVSTLNHFLKVD